MIRSPLPLRLTGLILGLFILACAAAASAQAPLISAEALREDLRFALDAIERLHPDPGHSIDRGQLDRTAARVEAELDRPMSRDQAWTVFARLNPAFADGHLLIGLPDWREESRQVLEDGGAFFPFEVALLDDGEVAIVSALGGGETPFAGMRIRRINGIEARTVVRELLARTHGDTPRFRAALLSQRWWFFFHKLFGASRSFDLVLAGEAPRRVTVRASRAVPAILQREADFDRQFRFELLPGSAALLTVNAFVWEDKARFFAFTREAFASMRDAGTRTLLIDVRLNGGGDDDMWRDGIVRYIADRPYRSSSRYVKRVLEPYRDEGEAVGDIVEGAIETAIEPARDEPLHFAGDVYVLIGRQTYSSAVLFSNVVQDFGFARLAGTGGAVRSRQSGSVQTLALPNSGLVLSFPRFVLDRPAGSGGGALLEPDLVVRDDPLRPEAAVEALLSGR